MDLRKGFQIFWRHKVVILLCGLLAFLAATTASQPPPPRTSGLKIIAPAGGGVYLGAYNHGGDGVRVFEQALGRKVAIHPFGVHGCNDGGVEGRPLGIFDTACHERLWQAGYVTDYGIETIKRVGGRGFTPQDVLDGKEDAGLRQVAQAIANWGRPIFWAYHREPYLQFGGYGPQGTQISGECAGGPRGEGASPMQLNHSCNYTQFGDPAKLDGPERYVAVARRIYDVVENEIRRIGKPSNVTWVMGGIIEYREVGFVRDYYPGDRYVDWMAFDWYPQFDGGISQYTSIASTPGWQEALQIAPQKPIMLMEFGVPGGEAGHQARAGWFRSFFQDLRTNPAMRGLAAVLYWQETQAPFNTRLTPGDPAAQFWRSEILQHPAFWKSSVETASVAASR